MRESENEGTQSFSENMWNLWQKHHSKKDLLRTNTGEAPEIRMHHPGAVISR